eukprot:1127986-Pyramimonas_sp.AAC.1
MQSATWAVVRISGGSDGLSCAGHVHGYPADTCRTPITNNCPSSTDAEYVGVMWDIIAVIYEAATFGTTMATINTDSLN